MKAAFLCVAYMQGSAMQMTGSWLVCMTLESSVFVWFLKEMTAAKVCAKSCVYECVNACVIFSVIVSPEKTFC